MEEVMQVIGFLGAGGWLIIPLAMGLAICGVLWLFGLF